MSRARSLPGLLIVTALAVLGTGCQSSRAQRGDYPRDGHMAAPANIPAAGLVHDRRGYTAYDAR